MRQTRFARPNMTNLSGRVGREVLEQIRNTPPSDFTKMQERADRCKAQLLAMKEKEMGRRDE